MKFKNIDFFRFILAVLIVLFHERKLIDLPNWLSGTVHCNVCVEFFFIIAGFLLFYKFKPNIDMWNFAKKRFFRLAPNLWLYVLIMMILSIFITNIHWNFSENILRILLLDGIGFSPQNYFNWFISALFWTSLFYAYISKIFDKKYLNLIIWLIVVFSFSIYLHHNNFRLGRHVEAEFLVFNIGICRALASMGLGYFINMFYQKGILQNLKLKGKIIVSLLECYLIGFFVHYLFLSNKIPGKTGILYVVMFTILFYLFLIKKGVISTLLDNDFSVKLGSYAYSIYCFHFVIIDVFEKYIYKIHPDLLQNYPLACYFTQTAIAIALGIVMYYIFEKPVSNYINKKFMPAKEHINT